MVSRSVIAIVPEDLLSDILPRIHSAGLGHTARVLRPRRGPLREQIRRAGVPVEQAPHRLDAAACVLMIMAAARSPMAADLLLQHGAPAVWTVSTSGAWSLVDDHVVTGTTRPDTAAPIGTPTTGDTTDTPDPI